MPQCRGAVNRAFSSGRISAVALAMSHAPASSPAATLKTSHAMTAAWPTSDAVTVLSMLIRTMSRPRRVSECSRASFTTGPACAARRCSKAPATAPHARMPPVRGTSSKTLKRGRARRAIMQIGIPGPPQCDTTRRCLPRLPHRVQRVGVIRKQVVLRRCRRLNAERASLIPQRKRLDTLKRFALHVAIQSVADALLPLRKPPLECRLIYADRELCGGLLLVVQLAHVVTGQLTGGMVERRPHVASAITWRVDLSIITALGVTIRR